MRSNNSIHYTQEASLTVIQTDPSSLRPGARKRARSQQEPQPPAILNDALSSRNTVASIFQDLLCALKSSAQRATRERGRPRFRISQGKCSHCRIIESPKEYLTAVVPVDWTCMHHSETSFIKYPEGKVTFIRGIQGAEILLLDSITTPALVFDLLHMLSCPSSVLGLT